jgi:hypothetical protein
MHTSTRQQITLYKRYSYKELKLRCSGIRLQNATSTFGSTTSMGRYLCSNLVSIPIELTGNNVISSSTCPTFLSGLQPLALSFHGHQVAIKSEVQDRKCWLWESKRRGACISILQHSSSTTRTLTPRPCPSKHSSEPNRRSDPDIHSTILTQRRLHRKSAESCIRRCTLKEEVGPKTAAHHHRPVSPND